MSGMFDTFSGPASIETFGTNNPKVAAFLSASFALENHGQLRQTDQAVAQSVGNAMRDMGITGR